jgi:hypothetical protein
LKNWRRLATRYDKTADSYLGFVLIAAVRLWMRAFVNRTYAYRFEQLLLAELKGRLVEGDREVVAITEKDLLQAWSTIFARKEWTTALEW